MSITPFPPPPSSKDPTNFDDRADQLLAESLPLFVQEANDLVEDVNAKQASAAGAAAAAAAQAGLAAGEATVAVAAAGVAAAKSDEAAASAGAASGFKNAAGISADNAEASAAAAAASAASVDAQNFATDYAGDEEPLITWPYMRWADTGNMLLRRRNEAGSAWVTEGILFKMAHPQYAVADIPTTDRGPIYVVGVGSMEWNGSAYAVISAAETVYGVAKVATQAQTDAGTDDKTIVTPKKLRWGISWLNASKGYVALPSWLGGFVIQWGGYTSGASGVGVSFAVPFPAGLFAMATTCASAGSGVWSSYQSPSSSAFFGQVWSNTTTQASGYAVTYIAIGR